MLPVLVEMVVNADPDCQDAMLGALQGGHSLQTVICRVSQLIACFKSTFGIISSLVAY